MSVLCYAVLEVSGDARGPEGVAVGLVGKARGTSSALDHPEDVVAGDPLLRELALPVEDKKTDCGAFQSLLGIVFGRCESGE